MDLKGMHSSNKDLDTYDKARYQNVIDGMQNTDALSEVKALANHMHAQSDSTYWIDIPSLGLRSSQIFANTLEEESMSWWKFELFHTLTHKSTF